MENIIKYEELPENMQKQVDELNHYSLAIQSDVLDSLESAESQEEFRSQVNSSMDEIVRSNRSYSKSWAQGKGALSMVKKDLTPILKGSGEKPELG